MISYIRKESKIKFSDFIGKRDILKLRYNTYRRRLHTLFLWNVKRRMLSGIIDIGYSGLGDPA